MKIKVSQHNLVNFLYENYPLFLEYASSKQINFKFNKQKDDIEVWYDQKQMQKVINNLLSNAVKHTKAEDTISINVSQEKDHVIIEIKDTGTGIAAAEIDKIFDRFYQTEHLNSLNTGGRYRYRTGTDERYCGTSSRHNPGGKRAGQRKQFHYHPQTRQGTLHRRANSER